MLRDFIRAILFVRCFPRNTLPRLNFLSHPELNIFHIIPVIEKKLKSCGSFLLICLRSSWSFDLFGWCALWHSAFSTLVGEDFGALARAEGVLKTLDKTPSPILSFLGFAAKGNALMAAEQFEAARMVYEEALEALEGTTHRRFLETVYYNLVQVALALGDWVAGERYYQAGLPLVQLNPEKESPRFDFLKGRLLASSNSPNLGEAQIYFDQSIRADETSGAVVLAAHTRFIWHKCWPKRKTPIGVGLC